jgi:Molybdopterin-binding domain of aldehyde dehydrogenase/Uncharacterised MFS-type transporter YbfB
MAFVAEAEVAKDGIVHVRRVVCAVDCGIVVNPDIVRAQIQSGIMFGITAALYGEITLKNSRVEQSNFDSYQILGMNEAPAVEVHIVQNQESPGGMGEAGTSAIVPAVATRLESACGGCRSIRQRCSSWADRGCDPAMNRRLPVPSATAAAAVGLLALASAMGIGRFSLTPILPLMQRRGADACAGRLATGNYLGYLAGSLISMAFAPQPLRAIRWGRHGWPLSAVIGSRSQSSTPAHSTRTRTHATLTQEQPSGTALKNSW